MTDDNKDDILGDGVFSYDPSSKTLTVNGDFTGRNDVDLIESSVEGLIIRTDNDAALRSFKNVMTLNADTTVTGNGKLTAVSTNNRGIQLNVSAKLTVQNTYLDVTGKYSGICGPVSDSSVSLTVYDATLHAKNTNVAANNYAIHRIYGGITLSGATVTTPAGGRVETGAILDANNGNVNEVFISKNDVRAYDLYIDGVQVSENNRYDVLLNGVFAYDPESKILTVSGNYTAQAQNSVVRSSISGLTVNVAETSALYSVDTETLRFAGDTTITGAGGLSATCGHSSLGGGVYVDNCTLTIKDLSLFTGGAVRAIGGEGGSARLVPDNSSVFASAVGTDGVYDGAIKGFSGGITLTDCYISSPEGAGIDGGAVTANGEAAKTVMIVAGEPDPGTVDPPDPGDGYELYVCDVQVTDDNMDDILDDGGSVFFDGQTLFINSSLESESSTVVFSGIDGLVVEIGAGVTLSAAYGSAFELTESAVVLCPGGATLTGTYGFYVSNNAALILSDANLTIDADYGIVGDMEDEHLEIYISEISITSVSGAIVDFADLLIEDCAILSPEGAYISNGCVKDANGRDAQTLTIGVGGDPAGLEGDVNGDGVVSIDDVSALLDALAHSAEFIPAGDMNGDAQLTIDDVSGLLDLLSNS